MSVADHTADASVEGGECGGTVVASIPRPRNGLLPCRFSSPTITEKAVLQPAAKWELTNGFVTKSGNNRPVFMMMTSDPRLDSICQPRPKESLLPTKEDELVMMMIAMNEAKKEKGEELEKKEMADDKVEEEEWDEVAPDGGWGWMVLLGSTLVNTLIPGLIKSFGVLFVEFLSVFNASPSTAMWIPGLTFALYNLLGPLASALSNRYSCRMTTLLGGFSASLGLALSYFATSIEFLYFSYGLLGGIGAGLSYTPGILIVGRYFEKRRGFANGVCMSGSALGSIILPPFINYLLGVYGYRGAILIMCGVVLNVCVGAALYQPVERHLRRVPRRLRSSPALSPEGEEEALLPCSSYQVAIKDRKVSWQVTNPSSPVTPPQYSEVDRDAESIPLQQSVQDGEEHRGSIHSNHPVCGHFAKDSEISNNCVRSTSRRPSDGDLDALSQTSVFNSSAYSGNNVSDYYNNNLNNNNTSSRGLTSPIINKALLVEASQATLAQFGSSKSAIVGSGATIARDQLGTPRLRRAVSVASTLSNSSSFAYLSTIHLGTTVAAYQHTEASQLGSVCEIPYTGRKNSRDRSPSVSKSTSKIADGSQTIIADRSVCGCSTPVSARALCSKLFDMSLVKNTVFLLITYSFATSAVAYTNLLIILPAHALSLGIEKSEYAVLLSIIAGSDLTGRICCAWLSDLALFPRKYFFIVGLTLSGIIMACMPFAITFAHLAVACVCFGLASGAYIGLMAVLLMDHLGAERLSSSFGLSLALNGVVMLGGPPAVGLIRERIGSYEPVLYILGMVLVSGGAIWVLEPWATRHEKSREEFSTTDKLHVPV